MKKLQQISLAVLFLGLMFYSQTITAQHHEMKMGQNHECNGIAKQIPNLTEQQQTQIKNLRVEHMKKVQQLKNLIDVKKAELKVLQTADKPDLNAINKKIDEKASLKTELEKERAAFRQKVRSLLNDEQKIIFDAKMQKNKHHKMSEKGKHKMHKKEMEHHKMMH